MNAIQDDRASKLKGGVWVVVALTLGSFLAAGVAPLAHAVPWSWEKGWARRIDARPDRICEDRAAQAALDSLVARLYPLNDDDRRFSIDVIIAEDPAVNAYAGLGGRIVVDSGLLAQAESPEEVAGVLAHEITHVARRHIMENAFARLLTARFMQGGSGWMPYFLAMHYTRQQEAQADEGALMRLQAAHIDNSGFRAFFTRMAASGHASAFLSDHPDNRDRIAMVGEFSNRDVTAVLPDGAWQTLRQGCVR